MAMADGVIKHEVGTASGGAALNPKPDSDAFEPERVVTVLAISPYRDDHTFLGNIFSHSNWKLLGVQTWQEALTLIRRRPIPVIIAESRLPDANWRDVLSGLARMAERPLLIVSCREADEYLWAEVLNLGGYDVLMKPFDATEVFRVVSLAWLNWKHSREQARGLSPQLARAAGF
jgi:DNA-binding response OmpR family regulator